MHGRRSRTAFTQHRGAGTTSGVAVAFAVVFAVLPVFSPATAAPVAAEESANLYRGALLREVEGDVEGARLLYEQVLAVDPEHRAARRALGYEEVDGTWVRGDDLLRARGFVHHEGRWMTATEFADATRPERHTRAQQRGEARVLACLALVASEDEARVRLGRRRLATVPRRFHLAPLARALRCHPASLRVFAAEALGRLGDPLAVPALLRCSVDDPDADVRAAAAETVRTLDVPGAVQPLGRALWSRDATVRVRAAEALGRIGDVAAAPYLVARWEKRSGAFPRVYFAQARQVSYIQDFDVEVAATSFIADPVVGVLQDGVVQDVRIHATEQTLTRVERVVYADALRRVSGVDRGDDVAAWRQWLDER